MDIASVFKNNEKWVQEKLNVDAEFFKNLATGQSPEMLYIGCSDSRVTAEDLMGCEPGDVFVHRNVANMVVSTDLNMLTVLKYAVDHLNVNHLVICGHYGCGGVKAAMGSDDLGILNPWLGNIKDVYRTHADVLEGITSESDRYKKLVELNVQEQCINLIKTSTVQNAIKNNGVTVHGWVFDIESGKLIDLKINFDEILKDIMSIYKIS